MQTDLEDETRSGVPLVERPGAEAEGASGESQYEEE